MRPQCPSQQLLLARAGWASASRGPVPLSLQPSLLAAAGVGVRVSSLRSNNLQGIRAVGVSPFVLARAFVSPLEQAAFILFRDGER